MLLLCSGIDPLPYEIVYHILRNYVYIRPFIRIADECRTVYKTPYKCMHLFECPLRVSSGWKVKSKIVKWFEENEMELPDHFKLK